jgi:hypothetical protein
MTTGAQTLRFQPPEHNKEEDIDQEGGQEVGEASVVEDNGLRQVLESA